MPEPIEDTKIKDLTLKATLVNTDEFAINNVVGGNLDRKGTLLGLKIGIPESFSFAISDNTTALTTGTKLT